MPSSGYSTPSTPTGDLRPLVTPRVMPALPRRLWSDRDWERVKADGPRDGDGSKWDSHCLDDTLRLYRRGTGYGIYEATFRPVASGGWKISRAVVEGHAPRYASPSAEYDCVVLELVISAVLLGEPARELRAQLTRMTRAFSGVIDMTSEVAEHSVLGLPSA
ncbi:hypothetical protein [Streptomyces sp. SS]|uniref:hypothetical protein n=1 Tax=Streptomyces sp. SS TaxID=260742 RepID=UPI00030F1388|nr:hypothetical protein [Streptomyces sp. SS]